MHPGITLPPGVLDEILPFHVQVDAEGRILHSGRSLSRNRPALVPGASWSDHIEILRPADAGSSWSAARALMRKALVIRIRDSELRLRGQLVELGEEGFLFVGAPLLEGLAGDRSNDDHDWLREMRGAGLELVDFAPHDTIFDCLSLLRRTRRALSDARDLAGQLRRKTVDLTEAKLAAEQASQAKSAFLAVMSHEIRTPMNGVTAMVDLMLESCDDATQRDCLGIVRQSSQDLLLLIQDILDFSKIEAGRVELVDEEFDLHELLARTHRLFLDAAEAQGIDFECWSPNSVPRKVRGDAARLRQVLCNLISNAVRFTERGEANLIASFSPTGPAEGQLRLAVIDTGVGMDLELKDRLFQPFVQEDTSTTRRFGGTGLGLSICRGLIELMGGTIGVESHPGQGTRFFVDLPVRCTSSAEEPLRVDLADLPASRKDVDSILGDLGLEARHTTAEEASGLVVEAGPSALYLKYGDREPLPVVHPRSHAGWIRLLRERLAKPEPESKSKTPLPAKRFPGVRVLVVEDNAVNRTVAKRMLEFLGAEVENAEDGLEAVRMFEPGRFDLVLMDCRMPNMDGYEATRHILSVHDQTEVPIVAFTANVSEDDRTTAKQAGMCDFLGKPITLESLTSTLERWVGSPAPDGESLDVG